MAKTTKTQATEAYHSFCSVIRNYNGGTSEENLRSAPYCYERLKEVAKVAEGLAENPGKHLLGDKWLWEKLSKTIPERLASFAERYGFDQEEVTEDNSNVIFAADRFKKIV